MIDSTALLADLQGQRITTCREISRLSELLPTAYGSHAGEIVRRTPGEMGAPGRIRTCDTRFRKSEQVTACGCHQGT